MYIMCGIYLDLCQFPFQHLLQIHFQQHPIPSLHSTFNKFLLQETKIIKKSQNVLENLSDYSHQKNYIDALTNVLILPARQS